MQSHAILEALKIKLKAAVRYFCQVSHIGIESNKPFLTPIILCLGEHSMFLLDKSMQQLLGEVFYAHITRVVDQGKDSGPQDVMRIEINEDRPKGIPAKITIISSEKNMLLKHLRCYWETDFMWRLAQIGFLIIDKEYIDIRRFKAKGKNESAKEKYAYCSNSSTKDEQKTYCYFFTNYLKRSKLLGEYEGMYKDEHYKLKVIINDPKQLEFMKDDLRSKTEEFAENELDKNENFCYLKNNPYLKKMNLVLDIAAWRGWEVLLKAGNRFISLIVLRRKFIPPLMDSGQQFIFITSGGKHAREICQEPADSIFTKGISNEYYPIILSQRCETLIMDEESANFYQLNLNIKPKCITLVYRLINSIIKIISSDSQRPEYKEIIEELRKTPNFIEKNESPEEIFEEFKKMSKATPNSPGAIKWNEKVSRYLAYALDGGLFNSKFTLEEIIEVIMNGGLKDINSLTTLKKCIKHFLHVRKIGENCDINKDELYEPLAGLVKDYTNKKYDVKKWTFNEKVMTILVEKGYLQRELDISGDTTIYPKLLTYLLMSPWYSLELRSVVCRVTVRIDDINEYSIFKTVIPNFIEVFCKGNYTLACQAAISLINLIYNNRENKQTLFKSLNEIIKRLTTKDQKLLGYTISILTNLASEASRRKVISNEIKDPLLRILKGKLIDKEYLSSEVVQKALTALITISKDHATLEALLGDENLKEICAEYMERQEENIGKITWFFEIMAEKSEKAKQDLGKIVLPRLLKTLKQSNNVENIKGMINLLKILIENSENSRIANENQLTAVLKQVKTLNDVRNDDNLPKIIRGMIKNNFEDTKSEANR